MSFPISVPKAVDEYQQFYLPILKSALTTGERTETLDRMKEERAKELSRKDLQDRSLKVLSLYKSVLEVFQGIETHWYKYIGGRHVPLLKEPEFYYQKRSEKASASLFRIVDHQLAKEALESACFRPGDRRYRTDYLNAKLRIYGEDGFQYFHLSSIAHELGHYLAESRLTKKSRLETEIASETMAQSLEYLVTDYVLRKELGSHAADQWREYQQRVDHTNYYFFIKELESLGLVGATKYLFDQRTFAFRETWFTAIGYQYVYAKASIIRARVLGRILN